MNIATAAQMREMDRTAIEERGIPSVQLMEAAACGVARAVSDLAGGRTDGRAVVFCGPGNNGGDGVAAARFLLEMGWEVRCVLVGRREKMSPDCREMERRLEQSGGKLEDFADFDSQFAAWCLEADVMVDALFGIGLNTDLRGDAVTAVQMMNTSGVPVVAVDIASGVEADTGRVLGMAVNAAKTVTFTLPKAGHFVGKGGLCCGALEVVDIGIPADLVRRESYPVTSVDRSRVSLPVRPRDAHKGDFGRVYILGGCVGFSGAPVMAAQAAVRTGAGLVTVGVPAPIWPVAATKLDEAMPHPLPAGKDGKLELAATEPLLEKLSGQGVCLLGPGLGRSNAVDAVVRHVLAETSLPVVLDADGINALAGHMDILDNRGACTILTPHDGEFARLTGALPGEDRLATARDFAEAHSCCLVLKGHRTITAFPDGTAYINTTGNPGMAKGGSGDVLSGILVSLLGQGFTAREAAPLAVWIHGRAGDLCADAMGEYSMTPTDIIRMLPRVMRELTK